MVMSIRPGGRQSRDNGTLVRGRICAIHEPKRPGDERTFDLEPLADDAENQKVIDGYYNARRGSYSKKPDPIKWEGLAEADFVRRVGSRVRDAHPARCGERVGTVLAIVSSSKQSSSKTITFSAQVVFMLDDGSRWEQLLPLSQVEMVMWPHKGDGVSNR
jgi:hypothetical protein